MIYMKSGAQTSVKLTPYVQVCRITIPIHLRVIGDLHIVSGGGSIPNYKFYKITSMFYCNVIHDITQEIYRYSPIIHVIVYKGTYLMYNYSIIIPYKGNLSNLDNAELRLKLAVTEYWQFRLNSTLWSKLPTLPSQKNASFL